MDSTVTKRFLSDLSLLTPNRKHRRQLEQRKENRRKQDIYRVVCMVCFKEFVGKDRASTEDSLCREGWQEVEKAVWLCPTHRRGRN